LDFNEINFVEKFGCIRIYMVDRLLLYACQFPKKASEPKPFFMN
jgi:hypothetical protein